MNIDNLFITIMTVSFCSILSLGCLLFAVKIIKLIIQEIKK